MSSGRKPSESIWIEKRPGRRGTSYRVHWRPNGGGSKTFPTRALAIDFKDKKIKEFHSHSTTSIDPELTFSEFGKSYLEDYSKTEKNYRTYRDADKPAIDQFSEKFGKIPLIDIKPANIAEYKAWLFKEKKYARNSVAMRVRALKAAFKYAESIGKIENVPFPKNFIPDYEFTGRYLEESELAVFLPTLKKIHPLTWRAACFIIWNGPRSNETINLFWEKIRERIDTVEGMRVTRYIMTIERKGAYRRTTKVKKRDVVIHPKSLAYIMPFKKTGQVFNGLTKTVLEKKIRRAAKKSGLGPITAHDLRHTWATNFMKTTGDLPGLMINGGWDSLEAVAVYQHLSKARAESVVQVDYAGLAPILLPNETTRNTVVRTKKHAISVDKQNGRGDWT